MKRLFRGINGWCDGEVLRICKSLQSFFPCCAEIYVFIDKTRLDWQSSIGMRECGAAIDLILADAARCCNSIFISCWHILSSNFLAYTIPATILPQAHRVVWFLQECGNVCSPGSAHRSASSENSDGNRYQEQLQRAAESRHEPRSAEEHRHGIAIPK